MRIGEMMSNLLQHETYLPADGSRLMSEIAEFLRARNSEQAAHARYFLSTSAKHSVEVPEEIYRVLNQVIEAMNQGLAVTVAPVSQTLTTQQAADLLGVSRPTVIRLLDDGALEFERIGSHRRILLKDLLAFRERRRALQYEMLDETSIPLENEEDLEVALAKLRDVRKRVADRRRSLKS
jgi:excisionase family DNA binding protein